METIYSISREPNIKKGLVEIINVYDHRYFVIAVDGKIIEKIYKEDFKSTVLKRSFIKKCTKISGLSENKLVFVYINWDCFGNDNIADYDSNNFMTTYGVFTKYLNTLDFLINEEYIKILATGIDKLEDIL